MWASQAAPVIKNLPARQGMQETQVQPLGQEDPLEGEMQLTPVSLAEKLHGQRSLRATAYEATKSQTGLSN